MQQPDAHSEGTLHATPFGFNVGAGVGCGVGAAIAGSHLVRLKFVHKDHHEALEQVTYVV